MPDGITHVQMIEMLEAAEFPLELDLERRLFHPIEQTGTRRSTTASSTILGRSFVSGQDPHEVTRARLAAAVERGVHRPHVRGAACPAIANSFAVRPVGVGAVFLGELRALVAQRGQDWSKVLTLDARFDGPQGLTRGLASYVKAGWERVPELPGRAAGRGDGRGVAARFPRPATSTR